MHVKGIKLSQVINNMRKGGTETANTRGHARNKWKLTKALK
jgi:hypothetical protein